MIMAVSPFTFQFEQIHDLSSSSSEILTRTIVPFMVLRDLRNDLKVGPLKYLDIAKDI